MNKPDSLRAHLTTAIPELGRDPERLLVFITDGHLAATYVPGLSFEYRYTLRLVVTDFTGHPDVLFVPLLEWLTRHQPELLANPANREQIAFETEILHNHNVDVEIRLPLTESVRVAKRAGGGFDIEHLPEPVPEQRLHAGRWQLYLKDELIAEWDAA